MAPLVSNRSLRILAVDDQPANLLLLKRILLPAGFELLEARSGAEALAVAREGTPDLILLDMHLPDLHGLEVMRRLRESAWGAGLRVVAMSALSSPEDQQAWLEAGCMGFVDKPITVKTFVQTISQWLPGAPPTENRVSAEGHGEDRLGDILLANRLVSPEQLGQAVAEKSETGRRLGQILLEQGLVREDDLAWALSTQLGYPYVFLTPDTIDNEAALLLPEAFLREHRVLPILKFGQEMTLAMADPTDQRTVDEIVSRTRLRVKRALALASNVDQMLDRLFSSRAGTTPNTTMAEAQYLQFHLVQAIQQGATAIHFDPAIDGQARVRYRLRSMPVDRAGLPVELHAAILRHLRALTGTGEKRAGSASVTIAAGGLNIHLQVTFLPTAAGPSATVALYPIRTAVPDLVPLGVSEETIRRLRDVLKARRGIVLVGCADRLLRSTLVHALIPPVQRGMVWSLETLPVHVRPTFNQTLITSPDETAELMRTVVSAQADLIVLDDASRRDALLAAFEGGRARMVMAGHPQDDVTGLVSQALDAAGPGLVASNLRCVLAARAVRLLCPACKQVAPKTTPDGARQAFAPQGCEACSFTGFRGQRVLTAIWTVDPEARALLFSGRLTAVLERIAEASGSQMRDGGLALVEDGLTSLEELAHTVEDIS